MLWASNSICSLFVQFFFFLSPWVVICKPGIRQSLIPRAAAAWIIYSPKNRLNSFSNANLHKGAYKNIFTVFPSHSPKVKAWHNFFYTTLNRKVTKKNHRRFSILNLCWQVHRGARGFRFSIFSSSCVQFWKMMKFCLMIILLQYYVQISAIAIHNMSNSPIQCKHVKLGLQFMAVKLKMIPLL